MKYVDWDPSTYTLENQLSDMLGGRDVITCDDGSVIKGTESHVDIFWPSSSDCGHGHGGFDYDSDGNSSGGLYHR